MASYIIFKFSHLTIFSQIYNCTFQDHAKLCFSFTRKICVWCYQYPFIKVPKLEHTLKQNANLSRSVLQDIQGCNEGC